MSSTNDPSFETLREIFRRPSVDPLDPELCQVIVELNVDQRLALAGRLMTEESAWRRNQGLCELDPEFVAAQFELSSALLQDAVTQLNVNSATLIGGRQQRDRLEQHGVARSGDRAEQGLVARSGDRPQQGGDRPQLGGDRPQLGGDRPQLGGDQPE